MSVAILMIDVTNQPPPLQDYDLLSSDPILREALIREGAGWALEDLQQLGRHLGSADMIAAGADANRNQPVLKSFDRYGHRLDEVAFDDSWHTLMRLALENGLHSSPWVNPQKGAHVARAAGCFMLSQIESGVYCPVSMTYAAVATLKHAPPIAAEWLPRIYSRTYDPRFRPAAEKTSALVGMGMTENQGGSDLRTNVTRAEPYRQEGERRFYRLYGHKWFMSAPMCDAFLILAQTGAGPTCFLVPRWTPEGTRNAIHIRRLKDKLGNRSNASSEVELEGALGELVGEEGRGIPTIIEMGNYTRLDCAIGTSGLMRQGLAQAVHHARHRRAFQKQLIDQPLMANVLADLAIESEAATLLAMRLARAYDEEDEAALAFRRVVTPAAKFWICKRGPAYAAEAMEVLGGNGYVEEFNLARLYREMPLNSIWEGSGNVMCLDVLRAFARTPGAIGMLMDELAEPAKQDARLQAHLAKLNATSKQPADEGQARSFVRDLAVALQAALLLRHATADVADAFCATRLAGDGGAYGLLPAGTNTRAIIDRAAPALN
ncbi:isovaleryl-CoA dehydrogenase [Hyphomicrobium sp.]|uniref:isovaleryl-CoA dehydrogenase n=1 Tax=Hyphomicrobium sp. TaxID=82 RepID=UPI002D797DAE|nr:isovaleryl-CoA dehydrogenase [Hyphomicrobium sp.]HET6388048.1 isovaleryl-CoA dehydrogenase [Hyphomicrobium sp.]